LILDGLSNLAMKPTETTNEVISRITRTVQVIKESFEDYAGVIPYHQMIIMMVFQITLSGHS
jgi:hypothetical protein